MICGGRYMSGDDAMRVFAAGSVSNEMRIEVKWRSGKRSVVNEVKANRIYEIEEAGAEAEGKQAKSNIEHRTSNIEHPTTNQQPATSLKQAGPVFEDISQRLQNRHHEEEYNDFERQPLLGRKLSQVGSGVGLCDGGRERWA